MIRALLFDVDGVLVESVRANAQFYRDLLVQFGFSGPTDEEQSRQNHLPLKKAIRIHAPDQSEELYERVMAAAESVPYHHEHLTLADEVATVFADLAARHRLGVVSSRRRSSLEQFLDYSGLRPYVQVAVAVEDTPEHKPHPGPLLHAAQTLGIRPGEALYVGDALTDIQAALAAGMLPVLFGPVPLPGAAATIHQLRELNGVINQLSP